MGVICRGVVAAVFVKNETYSDQITSHFVTFRMRISPSFRASILNERFAKSHSRDPHFIMQLLDTSQSHKENIMSFCQWKNNLLPDMTIPTFTLCKIINYTETRKKKNWKIYQNKFQKKNIMNVMMSCNYFWPYYVCFQYQNVRNISQKLGLIAHCIRQHLPRTYISMERPFAKPVAGGSLILNSLKLGKLFGKLSKNNFSFMMELCLVEKCRGLALKRENLLEKQ